MRIVIADDHALFRRGLRLVLEGMFQDVTVLEAAGVDAALAQLQGESVDLVLLDLAMPGMAPLGGDRHAGLARVLAAVGDAPVAILSAYTEPEDIARVVGMGARGYIPKSSDEEVLRHAISLVLSHNVYVPPIVLSAVASPGAGTTPTHVGPPATTSPTNPLDLLTPRQRATLNLIMLGQSNKEIARNLNLLESTVKAHVRVILQKLKASNRTQAARIAAELGWSPTSTSFP